MSHSPERQTAVGTLAALSRHRSPDDPAVAVARAAVAEQKLVAYVTQVVAAAPDLTTEQRTRVAALLLTQGQS